MAAWGPKTFVLSTSGYTADIELWRFVCAASLTDYGRSGHTMKSTILLVCSEGTVVLPAHKWTLTTSGPGGEM